MKDKGFTLMEMLGVIIVLAIIAVITIPIMINIIERTRKNAAKNTALNYLSGVEDYIQMNDLGSEKYSIIIEKGKVYQVSEVGYEALGEDEIKDKEIVESSNLNNLIGTTIKGDKPTEGIVSLDDKGKVEYAELIIKKYIVICTSDTNCNVNKAYSDRVKPKLTIGNVTSTKDSITVPYTLIAGTSGATVECLYGESEDNIKSKGVVDENNNKCELSNLKSDTTYYFKLTPTSGEGLVGKSASGETITQKGTISAILQKDGEKESDGKYYFDKDTTTNNIVLGDYCWLAINTDEEGNTRLIYNGEVNEEGRCTGENASIGESKYSDDSTISDYNSSLVKTIVDNWYSTNLATSYGDMISKIDLITREEANNVNGGYLVSGQSYWTQTATGESTPTTALCDYNNCSGSGSCESSSNSIYIVNISGMLEENNNGSYSECNTEGECTQTVASTYHCVDASTGATCTYQNYSNGGNSTYGCNFYTCSIRYCGGKIDNNTCISNIRGCVDYYSGKSCNYEEIIMGYCTATAEGSSLAVRPVITINNTLTIQDGIGTTINPYILK